MATITDPSPLNMDSGEVATAENAGQKTELLQESAGELDMANLQLGFEFRQHHIQRGTFTRGRASGATANVDFIGDLLFPNYGRGAVWEFNAYTYENAANESVNGVDEVPYAPIPGMCETMENPYEQAARVRITWCVSYFLGAGVLGEEDLSQDGERRWTNAGNLANDPVGTGARAQVPFQATGALRLFVNGVGHPFLFKRVRSAMSGGVPSTDYQNSETQSVAGYSDFQFWEFSAVIDATQVAAWTGLTKDPLEFGTHTVSIRCFHTNRVIRFKTRYIEWTYVK